MRRFFIVLVVVGGGVAFATPPTLTWTGELSFEFPENVEWTTDFEFGWTYDLWGFTAQTSFADEGWRKLTFRGAGKMGELELFPALEFDPAVPAFKAASFSGR